MAKKRQTIGCEQLIAAITIFAQYASNLGECDGVILQGEWEEVNVAELIKCVRENLEGKELVMEGVK